jgi:hypothetical protein
VSAVELLVALMQNLPTESVSLFDRIYLTRAQLAKRYQRTTRTIDRWVEFGSNGFPKPLDINGRPLWRIDLVEAYEASRVRMGVAS